MKTPTIIEEDDGSVSERIPSYVIDFFDILQRFSKHGDQRAASQLVVLLTDASFNMNIVKPYIRTFADCEDIITKNTMDLLKNDGVCRVLIRVRVVQKDGCGILYVNDVTDSS